ncbi:MAG TPA: ribosome biogenesis GTP-binding protein YihA/YsxC [Steroidobacteraceae bacterium]|nr:ribosome biogenesis GTP-binding protein YihA/YsxC [Steroidobacteraceae bacterium]
MSRFAEARFLVSAARSAQFPPDRGVEIAFAGRSNAGKSSAINAILARRGLARTSKSPGQTRLLNFFELAPGRRIVDLPGYGYARASARERIAWPPLIDELRARDSLRGLFLIVDSRRGLTELDAALIEWAQPELRGVHVLLSKADKLTRSEASRALQLARTLLDERASVQLFSALRDVGRAQAQRQLLDWLAQAGEQEGEGTHGT